MRYRLKIEVSLKLGHIDPEGETAARLLEELGFSVKSANVSKLYTILLEAGSIEEAKMKADEMCKKLLANPTKDDYSIIVREER